MPAHETTQPGFPVWIDLLTSNASASRDFYSSLFGWSSETAPEEYGGYVTFSLNGSPVAGLAAQREGSPIPDSWTVYLLTEDATATADAATAAGAQVLLNIEVGDEGTMVTMVDPTGAIVGAWQKNAHRGFLVVNEANAPVWFEEHARDFSAASAFYQDVFGWELSVMGDSDEFRMSTITDDVAPVAGIYDATSTMKPVEKSAWVVYFGVADSDVAAARIVELGGTVLEAPVDTPFGRQGTAADPTGATFRFISVD
jgi:uncharacterized protein